MSFEAANSQSKTFHNVSAGGLNRGLIKVNTKLLPYLQFFFYKNSLKDMFIYISFSHILSVFRLSLLYLKYKTTWLNNITTSKEHLINNL